MTWKELFIYISDTLYLKKDTFTYCSKHAAFITAWGEKRGMFTTIGATFFATDTGD